jgi:hypothetical protein
LDQILFAFIDPEAHEEHHLGKERFMKASITDIALGYAISLNAAARLLAFQKESSTDFPGGLATGASDVSDLSVALNVSLDDASRLLRTFKRSAKFKNAEYKIAIDTLEEDIIS